MLPQEKPLDYQTEEEYLMLQGAWRHTFICPWPLLPSYNLKCLQFVKVQGCLQWHNLPSFPGNRKNCICSLVSHTGTMG